MKVEKEEGKERREFTLSICQCRGCGDHFYGLARFCPHHRTAADRKPCEDEWTARKANVVAA